MQPSVGHVYLIREYDNKCKKYVSELKVGHTDDITKLRRGKSCILLAIWCEDASEAGKRVIAAFHELGVHRGDRGHEYFEVSESVACSTLVNIAIAVSSEVEEKRAREVGLAPRRPVEPILAIMDFIEAKRSALDGKAVVARGLYKDIIFFIEENRLAVKLGFMYLISELSRSYGVQYKPALVDGTIVPCFHFPKLSDNSDDNDSVGPFFIGTTLTDFDRVAAFALENLVQDPNGHVTLKQAMEKYMKTKWYSGKTGFLKEELENVLGVPCLEQKQIGKTNARYVYMGFKINA